MINYFATTNVNGKDVRFGIKDEDRDHHIYIGGDNISDKSSLLSSIALSDIKNEKNLFLLDQTGESSSILLNNIPDSRKKDVVYLDSFNILQNVDLIKHTILAQEVVNFFENNWDSSWSKKTEHILYNIILSLLEYKNGSLLDIYKMIVDEGFRSNILNNVKNKDFWKGEFRAYTDSFVSDFSKDVYKNINTPLFNIVSKNNGEFDININKIYIVNTPDFISDLFLIKIYVDLLNRGDVHELDAENIEKFNLFVNESTSDFLNKILSISERDKVTVTVAGKPNNELLKKTKTAIVFKTTSDILGNEFPNENVSNLDKGDILLKLSIDGIVSDPFSAYV